MEKEEGKTMTGKTRCFWLLSDRKTVREVDFETARELNNKGRHIIYVHNNREFFTTKKWVPMRQFIQCIDLGVERKIYL